MESKRNNGKKKGISPVIAAIILVAVTVALAIGVAVWMGALTFTFMATEQLLITDARYSATGGNGVRNVTVYCKNTGTTSITLSSMTLQPGSVDIPSANLTTAGVGDISTWGTAVSGGSTFEIVFTDYELTIGNTYELQILTARGNRFTYTFTA
ncbi:MAG: archaellin/type IV pilin N-terminal domain-containing protein [Candidatus Hydrothermarchaeales archaeon]